MNPHANEDVAWQRVQDLQREMENSRLMAAGQTPGSLGAVGRLVTWLRSRAGRLASRAFEPDPRARVRIATAETERERKSELA